MGDAPGGGNAPPTEEVQNLVLDEVTGERVSKTESMKYRPCSCSCPSFRVSSNCKRSFSPMCPWRAHILTSLPEKRRDKQRFTANKKAEKAAAAPTPPTSKKTQNAEDAEAQLDPRQYFELRSRAIKQLRETHQPNPYPHKFHVTTDMEGFVQDYEGLKTGEEKKDVEVRIGGRIYTKVCSAC